MSFSTCKYDRELLFFWSKIENLRTQLESIDNMKGDDKDKKSTSERRDDIVKEIETLSELQRNIEKTYIDADMSDYLEEMRSRSNAPTLEPLPSEYKDEEVEVNDRSDGVCTVSSINAEISELEASLVMAQIYEDKDKCDKIEMSLSALKSRRYDLTDMTESEKSVGVETSNENIDEIKKDIVSLRTQLGNLRVDMLDLKEIVMRVVHHLGLDQDQ